MKKTILGILPVFLFLVMVPLQSFADTCGCGREPGMRRHHGPAFAEGGSFLGRNLMQLDLNDKQREAIAAVRSRVERETIRKRADLEVTRVDLRELLGKDAVDMKAVEANLKKAEAVRTDLRLSHIKALEEIKAQLTPEQRTKLKEKTGTGSRGAGMQEGCPAYERMGGAAGKTGEE